MGFTVRTWAAGLGAIVFTLSALARADPPSAPSSSEEALRKYFEQGVVASAANRFDEAAQAFRRAWALSPQRVIACNIGNVEFRRKNYSAAAEFLHRCIEAGGPESEQARAQAMEDLRKTRLEVAAIEIDVADPAAQIVIDKEVVGRGGAPATYFVTPGPHRIRAQVVDRSTEARINADKGGSQTVTLTIEPATQPSKNEQPAPAAETPKPLAPTPAPGVEAPTSAPLIPAPLAAAVDGVDTAINAKSTAAILFTGGATIATALAAGIAFEMAAGREEHRVYSMSPAISKTERNTCLGVESEGVCQEYHQARDAWSTYNNLAIAAFVTSGVAAVATGSLIIASRITVKPTVSLGGLGVTGSW